MYVHYVSFVQSRLTFSAEMGRHRHDHFKMYFLLSSFIVFALFLLSLSLPVLSRRVVTQVWGSHLLCRLSSPSPLLPTTVRLASFLSREEDCIPSLASSTINSVEFRPPGVCEGAISSCFLPFFSPFFFSNNVTKSLYVPRWNANSGGYQCC